MLDKDAVHPHASSCCYARLRTKLASAATGFAFTGLVLTGAPAKADDLLNPQALVNVTGKYQSSGTLPQGAGVLDRSRRARQASPLGPSNAAVIAYGAVRLAKV